MDGAQVHPEVHTVTECVMTEDHDFDALRAKRNAAYLEIQGRIAQELGVNLQRLPSNFKPAACYCASGTGGPCEHTWDGEAWEGEDGLCWSRTCSRCGCTAISHDMRNAP